MSDFLEKREIGKTGLVSSRIGLGSTFNAPASAIEEAFEHGINYLYWGTVRQPSFAEAMRNLEKQHRDELIFTIQSYSQDPSTIEEEVTSQLKICGVQDFDFLLLGNRENKPADAFLEVFERLKAKGIVKFMSISSHNRPLIPKLMDDYSNDQCPYELLMFRYNPVHRGAERDVFPFIPEGKRPALLTYTSTRWGHLLDPSKMPPGEHPVSAKDCYRYSLEHDFIDIVCVGPGSTDQMREALAALEAGPLDANERSRIERIGEHLYSQYAPAYPDKGDVQDVEAGVAAH